MRTVLAGVTGAAIGGGVAFLWTVVGTWDHLEYMSHGGWVLVCVAVGLSAIAGGALGVHRAKGGVLDDARGAQQGTLPVAVEAAHEPLARQPAAKRGRSRLIWTPRNIVLQALVLIVIVAILAPLVLGFRPWVSGRPRYVERPSYTGERNGGVIVAFSDGYLLWVRDSIVGNRHGPGWQRHGRKVEIAEGRKADYYHVVGTNLVKTMPKR